MGLLGDLLALPIRVVNAPIRAAENFMAGGSENVNDDDRFLSAPLDLLAEQVERVDDGKPKKGASR